MSMFDTILDTIYADPNMRVGASYYSTTLNAPAVPVALLRRDQDRDVLALSQVSRVRTVVFEVRKSEIGQPERGGRLTITDTTEEYIIQSVEQTDDGRSWVLDVRPVS